MKLTMYLKCVCMFAACGLFGSALASPGEANAATTLHGHVCSTYGGTPFDSNFALVNNSFSTMFAVCAFPKSTSSALPTVKAHVFDGFNCSNANCGNVEAAICKTGAAASGGACGAVSLTGDTFVGDKTMTLSPPGVSSTDFVYVWVKIQGKNAVGVPSTLRGITIG